MAPRVEKIPVTIKESQRNRSAPTFAPGWIGRERERRMRMFVRHQTMERENYEVEVSLDVFAVDRGRANMRRLTVMMFHGTRA